MADIEHYQERIFEDIKNTNEYGEEYWYARDLEKVLQYEDWENFKLVIEKAKTACKNSQNDVEEHFADITKTEKKGSRTQKEENDIILSRYASYLIIQNGDPENEAIALGQTYFAVKTRQHESIENYERLSEEGRRLAIRKEMTKHNKSLAAAAKKAGVETSSDYSEFQNKGYAGLYDGLDAKGIHRKKGLKKSQNILDHMGSTELAANLFRATQAEEKLRSENIKGKDKANKAHYEVGKKVRKTIKELGGQMPEDLHLPEKSIGQIKRRQKKLGE